MPRILGLASTGLVIALAAVSCGGSVEARRGDEICALLNLAVQQEINEGISAVLSGASLDVSTPSGDACTQRFVSGDDWVEVQFVDVSMYDGDDLLDMGSGFATNGVDATQATVADGFVVAIASSNSPGSISTWDASLVAAAAIGLE